MVAKVIRFYGLGYYEIMGMAADEFNNLAKCIEPLKAEEQLLRIEASVFPYIEKDKDRREIIRKHESISERFKEKKVLSVEEALRALHG